MRRLLLTSVKGRLIIATLLGFASHLVLADFPRQFTHQGKISVGGTTFTGTGHFKFLLYHADTNTGASPVAIWSSADSSPANTTEPAVAVNVVVTNGFYHVGIGDTRVAGMAELQAPLEPPPGKSLFLRVWFSDGVNPTEQLAPDLPLASVPFSIEAFRLSGVDTTKLVRASPDDAIEWSGGDAGAPNSTAWNFGQATNVGATAWGSQSEASGKNSTAWSEGKALGENSTAWSTGTAQELYSTAWGGGVASKFWTTAWNFGEASATGATAWGFSSVASGSDSTAWSGGEAIGSPSTAWSFGSAQGTSATAWGHGIASETESTAWSSGLASGTGATAWGRLSEASGGFSTAWSSGKAVGEDSTAWSSGRAEGRNSTAWGNAFALSMNSTAWNSGEASGIGATAWSDGNATAIRATAWGNQSRASGEDSTAWSFGSAQGVNSTAWGNAFATGNKATAWNLGTASGSGATAWGTQSEAAGNDSVAWSGGVAEREDSTAWGNAFATGENATAWNFGRASGSRSTAWSVGQAQGYGSTALGAGVFAYSAYEVALGTFVAPYVPLDPLSFAPGDRVFAVGNGSDGAPNNALTILKNGSIGLNGVSQPVHPLQAASGAHLSAGGTWTNSSDRSLKENLSPVNEDQLLERIRSMPIYQWNYRSEGAEVRHVGPMAQDFHDAFALGNDKRTISTVDADGVAIAAIQALAKKVDQLSAENAELRERIGRLEEQKPAPK